MTFLRRLLVYLTVICSLGAHAPAALAGNTHDTNRIKTRVPTIQQDLTAYRADSDVFGWNRNFTVMGAIGSEIQRYPKGKQRGEIFMVIYDIGSVIPKHNVHVLYITQADMPHDPLPIDDVRDKMWGIDHQFQKMWPRRPKRKRPRSAMHVETLWYIQKIGENKCSPWIGFALRFGKKLRYQVHQPTKLRVSCGLLEYTDHRTYWGRNDIAGVMIRFDHSDHKENESSTRIPFTVAWKLGKEVRAVIRTQRPSSDPLLKKLKSSLGHYASSIQVEKAEVPAGLYASYAPGYQHLAAQLRSKPNLASMVLAELSASTSAAQITNPSKSRSKTQPQLIITLGDENTQNPDASDNDNGKTQRWPPKVPKPVNNAAKKPKSDGSFLGDFSP